MSFESLSPKTENISPAELYRKLGDAIDVGDNEHALTLLKQLELSLQAEQENITNNENDESEARPQEEAIEGAAEELRVDELVQEIYRSSGTEISIFGTNRGLEVPLSVVLEGRLDENNKAHFTTQKKGIEGFERGRNAQVLQTGVKRFVNEAGKNVIELVMNSRDAYNRFGYKGIQIVPADDELTAQLEASEDEMLEEVCKKIWATLYPQSPNIT